MTPHRVQIKIGIGGDERPNPLNSEIVGAPESRRMNDAGKRSEHRFDRLRVDLVTPEVDDRLLAPANYE